MTSSWNAPPLLVRTGERQGCVYKTNQVHATLTNKKLINKRKKKSHQCAISTCGSMSIKFQIFPISALLYLRNI
jgi:hypothetical protein